MDFPSPLARRDWLERLSVPALAATLGAGMVGARAAEPAAGGPALGARVYNIRDYGARGDGATLDSAAVQAAIDACHGDQGGTVLVPAGTFLVGTLHLKSNVTLHLATQGRLLGSPDPKHYRRGEGVPAGNGNIVLLFAADAENVTIEGRGTIDGNGLKFWTGRGDNTGPGGNSAEGYFDRPHLIIFYRVKRLAMRDVFLTASAYHCTRILQCERVHFDGVRIYNRVNKNNDGFHFNACQYVHVANCDVACQDDACALFGGNKFVTITNCTWSTRWAIFRFGGGHAENITVSNCVIYETYGCAIKLRCGANSRFENLSFSNLVMKDVTGPISVGLDSTSRRNPNAKTPSAKGVVRNLTFSNIRATVVGTGRQYPDMHWQQEYRPGETRTCITLNGINDEMLENITLSDIHVTYEGGGTAEEAALRQVPAVAGEYFEVGTPPAYGLFARNVRGLTVQNIRVEVAKPDLRPAIVLDHVTDATLQGVAAQGNDQAESALRFIDTRDVLVSGARLTSPARVFLRAEGAATDAILVDGGALKAAKPVEVAAGAKESAVRVRT